MVAISARNIRFREARLGYEDACRLARRISARPVRPLVHLHLEHTTETSTAALARLVLLRRELLARGGDLGIVGLRGKARALYEISRLGKALPMLPPGEA